MVLSFCYCNQRLARTSREFVDTSYAVDSMAPQVDALRKGFATLSDVTIEEIDSLRAELKSFKTCLHTHDQRLATLTSSSEGYKRMARELVTELETCKEQNRSLHREVESLKQSLAASEAHVSSLRGQVSSIGGTVSHLDESRRATAEVPTTVAAHSATLAEIIRDNQLMHEALLILTQSSKSLTVDLAPVREAALSSAPRALVDALTADVTIVQKTLEHLTAITSTLSKDVSDLSSKSESLTASFISKLQATRSEVDTKIADITAANTTHRKGIDAQLVTLSHQSDRLKGCFDECVRSIGSCNAAITSQCAASEAASAGAVTAVKRQIKDVEAAIQRQIDALTQAIHALAAVLNVAPTRV